MSVVSLNFIHNCSFCQGIPCQPQPETKKYLTETKKIKKNEFDQIWSNLIKFNFFWKHDHECWHVFLGMKCVGFPFEIVFHGCYLFLFLPRTWFQCWVCSVVPMGSNVFGLTALGICRLLAQKDNASKGNEKESLAQRESKCNEGDEINESQTLAKRVQKYDRKRNRVQHRQETSCQKGSKDYEAEKSQPSQTGEAHFGWKGSESIWEIPRTLMRQLQT